MTAARDIAVLGPLQLGAEATVLGAKQRRLLAALVLHANRAVSADRLVQVLWGDQRTTTTVATLHSHVSRLRRHLEHAGSAARLATAGSGYRLEVAAAAVDALLFEQLLRRAQDGAAAGGPVADLREALALWRGAAYLDLADDDAAQAEAARLEELRLGASEALADALVAQGQHLAALADLETLVRQHPYRDRLWSALILARYRSGRQAEALEAFQVYRRTLDEELGLEPSAALVRLHQDILEQAPHLLPTQPVAVAVTAQVTRSGPTGEPPAAMTERKLVTVLVAGPPAGGVLGGGAGLPGSGADPEEIVEALEPVLAVLVGVVHELGGTVLQAGPAGVTAVFGAPTAAEDHALRACLGAERLRDRAGQPLGADGLSVAVESGEVLLQATRSDAARGFEAVGEPLEQAIRAQRSASAGRVLVGPTAGRLAEGLLLSEAADDEPPGGWRQLIGVASSSAWDARARRGLSPLVGREGQLRLLTELVAAVDEGNALVAGVVGIVGDPGVGKSRLVYELAARVPAHWSVLSVAASPLDVAVPFKPLLATVREVLPLVDLAAVEGSATPLAALLGSPLADHAQDSWAALDPGVQRRRTISAVADLLLQRAADDPCLLVVEDAHWLDGETLAVLDVLVDRITSAPVLLLVTYRPEHDTGWANRPQFTQLRLDPLAPAESAQLAASMLGDDPSVHGLRAQLATWTGGVPLFLEESVRELTETRTLRGEPGGYVLEAEAAPLRLPARVHGVLAARIDRLPASEKRLLQAAAVVGTEGSLTMLAPVLDVTPDQVEADLPGLHRADLLYERRRRGERRFVFKHALVHDTAYASLPRSRRRVLHARAMDALGAAPAGQPEELLERLAHHATQAERWADAVELNRRAGERALHRCAYREAATLLSRALEAQRRLPPDPDREIDLLVQLRPAHHSISEFDAAIDHLVRAEELASSSGDPKRLLLILLHRGYLLLTRGHRREALGVVHRALAMAEQGTDTLLVAECRLALGQCLAFAGDPQPAIVELDQDMAERAAAPFDQRLGMAATRPVMALGLLGMSLGMLGDFGTGERRLAQADDIAGAVDRPIDLVVAALGRGVLELQRGRPDRAVAVLRPAQSLCADTGMRLIGRWVMPVLGEALTGAGEHAEAQVWLQDMLRAGDAAGVPLWQAAGHSGLAGSALALGRPQDAVAHAGRAVDLAHAWGYPLTKAAGLRMLAAGTAQLGDLPAAIEHAGDALREAERIGARPEEVRVRRLLAQLWTQGGRPAEATEHATMAAGLAAALGVADHTPA